MKRLLLFFAALLSWTGLSAQTQPDKPAGPDFDTFFEDATLRLDYVFCGDATHQEVFFQQACRTPEWAGRRQHLDAVLLRGNGQVIVRRASDAKVLYVNSFSTLFQEWQCPEEATHLQRAFENCFLVPFPREKVEVEIRLYDTRGQVCCSMRHGSSRPS